MFATLGTVEGLGPIAVAETLCLLSCYEQLTLPFGCTLVRLSVPE